MPPRLHRLAWILLTATATTTGCTAATTTPPSSSGTTSGTTSAGTSIQPATPRTIDPARRASNLNQMIDALGLDPQKRDCLTNAANTDPALNTNTNDTPATTRALIQQAINCGGRDQLTTKYLSTINPASPRGTRKDCIKTLFDRLDPQQLTALLTGDTTLTTQLETDITKTCTTTPTTT